MKVFSLLSVRRGQFLQHGQQFLFIGFNLFIRFGHFLIEFAQIDIGFRFKSIDVAGDIQVEVIFLDFFKGGDVAELLFIFPVFIGLVQPFDIGVGQGVLRFPFDEFLTAVDEQDIPAGRSFFNTMMMVGIPVE